MIKFTKIFEDFASKLSLKVDPRQFDLVSHLQKYLITIQGDGSFFSSLKFIKHPLESKSKKSYSGIYIWGGVGRGKSMMLNLFYDNIIIKAKKKNAFS